MESVNYSSYVKLYEKDIIPLIEGKVSSISLKQKHKELKCKLITKYVIEQRGSSTTDFEEMLNNHFEKLVKKGRTTQKPSSKAKLELPDNQNKVKIDVINLYKNEMGVYFQLPGTFYLKEKLIAIHEMIKKKLINKFKDIFVENTALLRDITNLINDQLNEVTNNNNNRMLEFKSNFYDKELVEICEKYSEAINKTIKEVENENELHKENVKLKKTIFDEFAKQHNQLYREALEYFWERIDKDLNSAYKGAEEVFQLHHGMVKRTVREHYKQKMENEFLKRSFYLKNILIKIHETIITELAKNSNKSIESIESLVKDIFVEFEEMNYRNTPKELVIGIDLGTTNSCVSLYAPGFKKSNSTVVIPSNDGSDVTPSVVTFLKNKIIVGIKAKNSIEDHSSGPQNTIHSVKRLIGQTFDDLEKMDNQNQIKKFLNYFNYKIINQENRPKICVRFGKKEIGYSPEQISALILAKLKSFSERFYSGTSIKKAVITVPAYFNEAQKHATKQAGKLAGLDVIGIINEPTAAAIAFKLSQNIIKKERLVLIYDFGGGTFDVAIVRIKDGNIVVENVTGDNHLGGDDIDNNLIDYCFNRFIVEYNLSISEQNVRIDRLRYACEKCKIELSTVQYSEIYLRNFYKDYDLNITVTRKEFEEINMSIILKSINFVKDLIFDTDIQYSDITDIVLVGGTTRIPIIKDMLSKLFNNRPLNQMTNPQHSVAEGAAIYAATLCGQLAQEEVFNFTDITTKSLGYENFRKEMSFVIPRKTRLPVRKEKLFTTNYDRQNFFEIIVYEGEHKKAAKNTFLGKFILTGVPLRKKGTVESKVIFEINREGILSIQIECEGISICQAVKEHSCLYTEQQIQDLLSKEMLKKAKNK